MSTTESARPSRLASRGTKLIELLAAASVSLLPAVACGQAPPIGVGLRPAQSTQGAIVSNRATLGNSASAGAGIGVALAADRPGPGALVAQVYAGGPAGDAGLRPGDRIVTAGGAPVAGAQDLQALLTRHRPGDVIAVTVNRDSWRRDVQLRIVDPATLAGAGPQTPEVVPAPAPSALPPGGAAPPPLVGPPPWWAVPRGATGFRPTPWEVIKDPYLRARYTTFTD